MGCLLVCILWNGEARGGFWGLGRLFGNKIGGECTWIDAVFFNVKCKTLNVKCKREGEKIKERREKRVVNLGIVAYTSE